MGRLSPAGLALFDEEAVDAGDRGGLIKRRPRSASLRGIRPLSTGGKWTERPPGGHYTKGEMPPGPPVRTFRGCFLLSSAPRLPRGFAFSPGDGGRGKRKRAPSPVLPPSDEGGGKPEGLDGGRDRPGLLRSGDAQSIRIANSLPQSPAATAPSSEGAKGFSPPAFLRFPSCPGDKNRI